MQNQLAKLLIFPSSSGKLFLKGTGTRTLDILTMSGKVISRFSTTEVDILEIDVSQLVSGWYIIRMMNNNGDINYEKFLSKPSYN